jgi:hypothetical protein
MLAPAMFGRWSRENFFRYMRHSFNLDGLVDCRSEDVPETIMVVNPAHRCSTARCERRVGVLNRRIAGFCAVNLDDEIEPVTVEAYAQKKSDLQEVIRD